MKNVGNSPNKKQESIITFYNVNVFLNRNCFWRFRTFQPRPRRLLSADGKRLVNLWFIPHYTDVLLMFRALEEKVNYLWLINMTQCPSSHSNTFSVSFLLWISWVFVGSCYRNVTRLFKTHCRLFQLFMTSPVTWWALLGWGIRTLPSVPAALRGSQQTGAA